MDFAKVNVEARTKSGKGAARKARAEGKCPAILYGHKEAPVPLTIDPLALMKSLDKEKKRNTVFSLAVADGNGKAQDVTAMIRDFQIHPISRRIVHVDFIRVDMNEQIRVTVPVHFVGTPAGVINGGQFHSSLHSVQVAAKPDAIPTRIDVDISALNLGEALHISDLKLPPGVRALQDAKQAVGSVVAPRAEKTETPAAAAPAEGEKAAEGDKAAAGADKAAAAPAAKKEGGGDKKK